MRTYSSHEGTRDFKCKASHCLPSATASTDASVSVRCSNWNGFRVEEPPVDKSTRSAAKRDAVDSNPRFVSHRDSAASIVIETLEKMT